MWMIRRKEFPEVKRLTKAQREDYMIMDDQYFSFDVISRIYFSVFLMSPKLGRWKQNLH